MPYAILCFEKQTSGASGRLEAHHEREKKTYASNPDIDKSRSKDNYHLITPKSRYSLEINRRIQAAGCKTRKNIILGNRMYMVDMIQGMQDKVIYKSFGGSKA